MKGFGQLAEERVPKGISYDLAIPQDWADKAKSITGIYPVGEVVWAYGKSLMGQPYAITLLGWICLVILKNNYK